MAPLGPALSEGLRPSSEPRSFIMPQDQELFSFQILSQASELLLAICNTFRVIFKKVFWMNPLFAFLRNSHVFTSPGLC